MILTAAPGVHKIGKRQTPRLGHLVPGPIKRRQSLGVQKQAVKILMLFRVITLIKGSMPCYEVLRTKVCLQPAECQSAALPVTVMSCGEGSL